MWARAISPLPLSGADSSAARDVAVVDVGSNSVRLVLYRVEGRAIWTVFNEKVLAGLGRDMVHTGALAPDGVKAALGALRRFRAVLDAVRPAEIYTAATAAVREARDRDAFLNRVRAETGFNLRVLSGEEEAYLAALGVIAGEPLATGVVGDLGGSSLELIKLSDGKPGRGVTLPLGPFALGAPKLVDAATLGATCADILRPVAGRFSAETFHAVGGAWRNLALVHMNRTGYPLQIVHQYEMSAADAVDTAAFVAAQSKGSLERIAGVSKKRAETLPYSAVVLRALIETLRFEKIAVSAYGLREGLLFEAMSPSLRALDPLVEGCAALGSRHGVAERLGPVLESWLEPLWTRLDPLFPGRDRSLLAAACRLTDLGARLHPDHRADLVFEQILCAPIPGQSHAERAFIALAVFHRYAGSDRTPNDPAIPRVLSVERRGRAEVLGAAMRLGCDLSGRSPELLGEATLRRVKADLVLTVKPGAADLLLGEQTTKRAQALANALGAELKIRS